MPPEQSRLEAVRRYQVLDTPPEAAFDRVTRLAALIFGVPIAIISIVDEDRIWFKSRHGLEFEQIPRSPGLCASAIDSEEAWLLTDASMDPRSAANPLVAGEFGLRFYLGIPLRTSDGFNLGTLCVTDKQPRTVTDEQITSLKDLAAVVVDELEVRLNARKAIQHQKMLFKEIHHRVRNNLQAIASLLHLQQRSCPLEAIPALQKTAHRVQAIALLHHEFHSGSHVEFMNFKTHLLKLTELSVERFGALKHIGINIEGDDCYVTFDEATPLSLMVAEMVSNSCQHAFPDKSTGLVKINVKQESDQLCLLVSDDGIGFCSGIVTGGMGIPLIKNFVGQLKGQLRRVHQGPGVGYELTVPLQAREMK